MSWHRSTDGRTIHAGDCVEPTELILWAQGATLAQVAEHHVNGNASHEIRPCEECIGERTFQQLLLRHLHQVLGTIDARLCRDEYDLQTAVESMLDASNIPLEREHKLHGTAGRVDFYLPTYRTALEVKTQGAPTAIRRQLERYAACDNVQAIALVTTQNRHRTAADPTILGTPARIITLTGTAL